MVTSLGYKSRGFRKAYICVSMVLCVVGIWSVKGTDNTSWDTNIQLLKQTSTPDASQGPQCSRLVLLFSNVIPRVWWDLCPLKGPPNQIPLLYSSSTPGQSNWLLLSFLSFPRQTGRLFLCLRSDTRPSAYRRLDLVSGTHSSPPTSRVTRGPVHPPWD